MSDLGIHVMVKLHPEMHFELSEIVSTSPHVELITTGRSEDFLAHADALLVDYPMQTTMGAALKYYLPIVRTLAKSTLVINFALQ